MKVQRRNRPKMRCCCGASARRADTRMSTFKTFQVPFFFLYIFFHMGMVFITVFYMVRLLEKRNGLQRPNSRS